MRTVMLGRIGNQAARSHAADMLLFGEPPLSRNVWVPDTERRQKIVNERSLTPPASQIPERRVLGMSVVQA
jgi:hypothetical protein